MVKWDYKRQANIRANHVYLLQAERLRRTTSAQGTLTQRLPPLEILLHAKQ